MERTVRDIITRVQGLRDRIEQQPLAASREQLNAIHMALKSLLQRVQGNPTRKGAAPTSAPGR